MPISTSGPTGSPVRLAVAGIWVMLATAACTAGAVRPSPTSPPSSTALAPPATPPTPRSAATPPAEPSVQQLASQVSMGRALQHLQALQEIADEHGGNRATGTPGYDASVDYVTGALRAAGFEVSTPTFEASGSGWTDPGSTQRNVIAETRTGDKGHVVMIGAHLDSVEDGPGIVDNGSGVASLLEIAARLGADPAVQNTVRFAFFGAEENGAEGSTAYVENLPADDRNRLKLYLNVDMVASPNGGYIVQGGHGDDLGAAGPPGSAVIGGVLVDQLVKAGVTNPEVTEFVGDDESAFIEAGVPVGGAENGDTNEKSLQQAEAWGGEAGEVFDRCYHQSCDTVDNVNHDVLQHYLRALAGTLAHFATSTDQLR